MTLLRLFLGLFPYRYETDRKRIFISACAGRVSRRRSGAQPKDCDCPECQ